MAEAIPTALVPERLKYLEPESHLRLGDIQAVVVAEKEAESEISAEYFPFGRPQPSYVQGKIQERDKPKNEIPMSIAES
jgi:hypothetical protein